MSLFDRTYELSIARDYVAHWGMGNAVRELIQNGLDSDSPFVWEIVPDEQVSTLILTSRNASLAASTLLLGTTSKADSKDTIGSFGEGYKIAMLVLTRLGYRMEIRNGELLWSPRFQMNKRFGVEQLVVDETAIPQHRGQGLEFLVHGLSDVDVSIIRESCLQMQDHVGQIHSTKYGDILLERPGKLYVGGLFICRTELAFGYNFKPEFLKLERDRNTVDGWDLKRISRDAWFETGQFDRIAEMIDGEKPDLEYAEYSSPPLVKEACYRLFRANHPGSVVAKNQAELLQLVAAGMEKVVVVNSNIYENVRQAESYQNGSYVKVRTPQQRLADWFQKAKYRMGDAEKRSFKQLIDEAKSWRLS